MKKLTMTTAFAAVTGIFLPLVSHAEGLANDIHGLQGVLDGVYNDMLSMCSNLVGVGQGIAGFGALWYIAARVYRQIANAEPLDFYPLMRPFGIGLAIMLFPAVIGLINGIMQPTVSATAGMVQNSDAAIARLLQAKEAAVEKRMPGKCTRVLTATATVKNGINIPIPMTRPVMVKACWPASAMI